MSFYANPTAPERGVKLELDHLPTPLRQSLLQTSHPLTPVLCVAVFDTFYLIVPWWQTHKLNQVLGVLGLFKTHLDKQRLCHPPWEGLGVWRSRRECKHLLKSADENLLIPFFNTQTEIHDLTRFLLASVVKQVTYTNNLSPLC